MPQTDSEFIKMKNKILKSSFKETTIIFPKSPELDLKYEISKGDLFKAILKQRAPEFYSDNMRYVDTCGNTVSYAEFMQKVDDYIYATTHIIFCYNNGISLDHQGSLSKQCLPISKRLNEIKGMNIDTTLFPYTKEMNGLITLDQTIQKGIDNGTAVNMSVEALLKRISVEQAYKEHAIEYGINEYNFCTTHSLNLKNPTQERMVAASKDFKQVLDYLKLKKVELGKATQMISFALTLEDEIEKMESALEKKTIIESVELARESVKSFYWGANKIISRLNPPRTNIKSYI